MTIERVNGRAYELLEKYHGRRLFVTEGPNDMSEFEGWIVGDRIVIVQLWRNGGCDHYVQSKGTLWSDLEQDLHRLVEEHKARIKEI
jgi:hypothetical protein